MDWNLAIERQREPLLRIVLALFALIGIAHGGTVERLSWPRYRAVLRILRPAEWAVRRLIFIAAHWMVVKPSPVRPARKAEKAERKRSGKGRGRTCFQLFDPRQPFEWSYVDTTLDAGPKSQAVAAASLRAKKDTVNAQPLCRRLAAIKAALEDLISQAKRYARWKAKPFEKRRPKLVISMLRPGALPKFRKTPGSEVHAILKDCHWLARNLPEPDTS